MKWISVKDRLPKEDEYVIGADDDNVFIAGVTYLHEESRWYMYGDYYVSTTEVLWWMPFPDAPNSPNKPT